MRFIMRCDKSSAADECHISQRDLPAIHPTPSRSASTFLNKLTIG